MSAFLKNWQEKGTWRQEFICLRQSIPSPHMNKYPRKYSHPVKGGGGGGGVDCRWTSEKVRGALVPKRGRKYQHDWLYLQSINSIRHH